ncbi:MAG: sugar phosphate isomerase/epimerase [Bryobacterales bacterium]
MTLDRREFMLTTGAGALVGCSSGGEAPSPEKAAEQAPTFSKPLGAQLYTLRFVLPDNTEKILKDLAAIGYTEVEVLQNDYPGQAELIRQAGLKAVSMHLYAGLVTGMMGDADPPQKTVEAAAEFAKSEGLSYVVMPYLPQDQRGSTLDHYKAFAAKLNKAGEAAKAAGVGFAYHNHAFEFEPMEGSTPFATLLAETDPLLVQLELDVFWVSVAGNDPVAMLAQQSGRVPLVHLKDKAPETPQQYKEGVDKAAFREVGNGSLDFTAILKACEQAGVQHYFVEQDQTSGDPLASLRQSYEHIRGLEV